MLLWLFRMAVQDFFRSSKYECSKLSMCLVCTLCHTSEFDKMEFTNLASRITNAMSKWKLPRHMLDKIDEIWLTIPVALCPLCLIVETLN